MRTALFKVFTPVIALVLSAPAVLAQQQDGTLEIPTGRPAPLEPVKGDLDVEGVLDFLVYVANIFIAFVAIISVIMIIYGGFQYATSGASEDGTKKARSTITYGVIGLAVALLAFAVVAFVNDLVSGF